jgi:hypothetical protein
MIHRLLLLVPLFTAVSLSAAMPSSKKDIHLFLLAGQSNMAGRGHIRDLTPAEAAPDPRILALNTDNAWQPAVDPLHWDKREAGVGPGIFFAKLVAAKSPGVTIGLIPTACGGSPITAWAPGQFFAGTKSLPYDDALARARRAMQDGTLKAILWHQGESDSSPQNAPLYEKRLVELITRFRTDLNAPDLPFIIGQLGQFPGKPWNAHQIEVDRVHRAIAEKAKNVRYVSSEKLGSIGDNLHFNTSAYRLFAQRYADAYLQMSASK